MSDTSDFIDFATEGMAGCMLAVGAIIFSPILVPLYILYLIAGKPKGRVHHGP